MSDRPRWGIRTALISFVLSGIITSAFILIWPRQTIAQCLYVYNNDPSEQLILGWDMTGCDEAIEEAAKSGNIDAAVVGANYFKLYRNDDRKYVHYLRISIELGDNRSILQLAHQLLYGGKHAPGEANVKNCPEVLGLLKKYKLHALTPSDESTRDYYLQQKGHFEDYRAACSPSSSKANIGGGHAAHEQ